MASPACTVWVKKSPLRDPDIFHFFHKRFWIFSQFLHTYYTIIYTLEYKILFKYLQLRQSYAILSATNQRIFTFHENLLLSLLTEQTMSFLTPCHIQHVCWHYKSVYFVVTCHRQRSTKLSMTYANVWTHAFWPMVDILSILRELGCRA